MSALAVGGMVLKMCSELRKLLVILIKMNKKFSTLLNAITSKISALESLIPQIEELNEKLKISNKETASLRKILNDGIELVRKCSNDPKWYEKATYAAQLTALDESLKRELDLLTAHAARDTREVLLFVRKHDKQLAESLSDGRETLDAVKETMKMSGLIIIIVIWVILLILILPRERKRIATAVPNGIILCKVCKSVVEWVELVKFLVWSIFVELLAYAVYALYTSFQIGVILHWIVQIHDHYRRGFTGSKVCKFLFAFGEDATTLFVLYVCSKCTLWIAF